MSKSFTRSIKTLGLATVLSLAALGAQAQPHGPHGRGPGGPGPGGPGMFAGPFSGHVLEGVDATDAQRDQIRKIMEQARNDLKGQRETLHKLHQQGQALFAAPTIDAAAIETLRQQTAAQHDIASKRMSQALVEAARVLTPEQRAKIAERQKKREARMAERMKKMKDRRDAPPPPPAPSRPGQ